MNRSLTCLFVLLILAAGASAQEIGYVEDFALAPDRAEVLDELIPGTEEYYFYHCLYYEQTGQWDQQAEMLRNWISRHRRTGLVRQIENRRALLRYGADNQASLRYLIDQMNVQFNHQREPLNQRPTHPTALDPALLELDRLAREAFRRHPNSTDGFEDLALHYVAGLNLDDNQRTSLLRRLNRPDVDAMVELVLADLSVPGRSFGWVDIHRRLTQAQLDELRRRVSDLINDSNFVNTYMLRLLPSDDEDIAGDPEAKLALLQRQWAFVGDLPPVHNSLKAAVLYAYLDFNRTRGVYDKELFMEYIRLPRPVWYVEREYMRLESSRRNPVNLNADYREIARIAPIQQDEPLVREYLMHFFAEEDSITPYQRYLENDFLRAVLAETKILAGDPDVERWASMLGASQFQQLRERIELNFPPTRPQVFGADEAVTLELDVKNVETLIMKVFRIHAENYYRQQQQPIGVEINLDGLVANSEQVFTYEQGPLRRHREVFELSQIDRPGVYVVDFIGNGVNSRAVIHKGMLTPITRNTAAGILVWVLDEDGRVARNAELQLGGHRYQANENGAILLPFSTEPGPRSVVLTAGDRVALAQIHHPAETYQLQAGIYVAREDLLTRREATVLVRPTLLINGQPTTLGTLENVALTITTTDLDGVSATREIRDIELSDDGEYTHTFRIADRLATVEFVLRAEIEQISTGQTVELTGRQGFQINQIDRSNHVADAHLRRVGSHWLVEVLGKTGEVRQDVPLNFTIKHRWFRDPVQVTLQSDENGRIDLGELPGVEFVRIDGGLLNARQWSLPRDSHNLPQRIHARAGETILLPQMFDGQQVRRDDLSLLALRAGLPAADVLDAITLEGGFIRIEGLDPGDYSLVIRPADAEIRIAVAEGESLGPYVVGDFRVLERIDPSPLQITGMSADDDSLTVHVANAGDGARVHVIATRYAPAWALDEFLAAPIPEPGWQYPADPAVHYAAGRNIGDEYRYILERQYAARLPGNMLRRPSLLLNPWVLNETRTGAQAAAEGEAFGPSGRGLAGGAALYGARPGEPASLQPSAAWSNLDFLAETAAVVANLAVEDGKVVIDRSDLGPHQHIHIVAVDSRNTAVRHMTLDQPEMPMLDLRLAEGLDPQGHFTEQKQVDILVAGQRFVLDDLGSGSFEVYDSIGAAWSLMMALTDDATLEEFGFITTWNTLDDARKRELYSEYACHELHLFLARHDRAFFEAVVRPYLANKLHKTFLDQYLLAHDVDGYLQPWDHARLNVAERVFLGEAIPGEQAAAARHIEDLYNLLPPDPQREDYLFEAALLGRALEDKSGAALVAGERQEAVSGLSARSNELRRGSRVAESGEYAAPAMAPPGGTVMAEFEGADLDLADGAYARRQARRLYVRLEQTKEYAENNYYHLPIEAQDGDLIAVSAFWNDYAGRGEEAFLSPHLPHAAGNFAGTMLALSVLDLPFESAEHETEIDGRSLIFTAGSPAIVFHKQIRPAEVAEDAPAVLVGQNFFRADDRYRHEGNTRLDKFVTDEFLPHVVYGCQVVLTNPTSSPRQLTVLTQIPRGAMPVAGGKATRTQRLELQPYSTARVEYFFYFPAVGDYLHYPVHVAEDEKVVAAADAFAFHVVAELSEIDTTSWAYVSQHGTPEQTLAFLRSNNVHRLDLGKIAWRMRDKAFYQAATSLLAERHEYQSVLWSYSLMHNDVAGINQFLQYADGFVSQCGPYLRSELLTIDPVERRSYQHLEYEPLVNARQHQLGQQRRIVNDRFNAQYHRLMNVLAYRPALDDEDRMSVTYYLLLQDRVAEAMEMFAAVDPANLEETLQHDYFQVYLGFYYEDPDAPQRQAVARLAEQYQDYPVDRWRTRFADAANQLAEIAGQATAVADPNDRTQQQTLLAATEPSIEFTVEGGQIQLNARNLPVVRVNYYLMDVELLFSRNPFVQEVTGQFDYVQPNATTVMEVDNRDGPMTITLPEQVRNRNVLIEIVGASVRKSQPYFSNSLDVRMIENYGQLQVSHSETGQALPAVYVKVYAEMNDGSVAFFKDGYTDLRGRFDYTSLSTDELQRVRRFSVLILSDEHGAVIREAQPPQR